MSFTELRQILLGQLSELEAKQKKLKATGNNALIVLTQKVNPYCMDILDLEEDTIASAATDLQQALHLARETQTHIDNIKHQLNG